jgi:glycylpeptide N-tetradecanoyltransferase
MHKFWSTQPVTQSKNEVVIEGPIQPVHTEDVRTKPYNLPPEYQWVDLDVTDNDQINDLHKLLLDHYVEDDESSIRLAYSKPFLSWALTPPAWDKTWHVGVRTTESKKLVGFISGVPAVISVHGVPVRMLEINFLCVHKKLRSKRLTPVLIKEITRRARRQNIFQAVYTAGKELPGSITKCRYHHRSLDPLKLIESRFSHLPTDLTLFEYTAQLEINDTWKSGGVRPMTMSDVTAVTDGLAKFLATFDISPIFSENDVAHWFLPRDKIVHSYVIEKDGVIETFFSFYTIPSTVLNQDTHNCVNGAYSFYHFHPKDNALDMYRNMIYFAKNTGHDVLNTLSAIPVDPTLRFVKGTGELHYYLFNWQCKHVEPENIAVVLV